MALLAMFPSPKGGGPIEAWCVPKFSSSAIRCFHRRKAVAPLKHVITDMELAI